MKIPEPIIEPAGGIGRIAGEIASAQARKDAVDLLFVLTSYPTFASLRAGRSQDEVCRLLQAACRGVVASLLTPARR